MRRLDFFLTEKEEGRRVGRLVLSLCGVSAGQYARLKRENGVLLCGVPAHADERAHAGQTLTVLLPDAPARLSCARPAFLIAYEDEDLLIVDKPAPLSTMRSPKQESDSLEERVSAYLGVYRPVNRLDKGTSGLMSVAKSAYAQSAMQKLLHTENFIREYLAVVEGEMEREEGVIDLPILSPKAGDGIRHLIDPDGKPSVTLFRTLRIGSGRSLVRLALKTGRTHQIRVHMAALGHPVTGDYLYGTPEPSLPGRFALHSARICLLQPVTHQKIERVSPLPLSLAALLEKP